MNRNGATLQTPLARLSHGPVVSLPASQAGTDRLIRAALDTAPIGLVVVDSGLTIRMVTSSAAQLLGCDAESCGGSSMTDLAARCTNLDAVSAELFVTAMQAGPEPRQPALNLQTRAGNTLAAEFRAAQNLGWVLTLSDVTQTRRTENWLLEQVSSDPVTGLWNRHRFLLMLEDALARAAADASLPAPVVVLIGLERCRPAADPAGFHTADMIFRMASERVSALLSDADMFARMSEREFAVALTWPDSQAGVEAFCARVHEALSRPFVLDGHVRLLGCTIGVACAPDDGTGSEQLTANARLALDASGAAASGPVRFYEPYLLMRAQKRQALESDLRHALPKREFELHYQPQVDVLGGRVVGMEALVRWRNPSRGLVPPSDFIQLTEQLGMIDELGAWVLREACREAISWPDGITVAVNASPLQFETGRFARVVADALNATGLPAHRLEVEITENLLLADTGEVASTLAALQAMGVRVVLDDFGTGYASLSQLSRFRFDKIKIDRSFVGPDSAPGQNSVIVRSIAALGRGLGIPVTVEGVETETQLDRVKADGGTCVQGYYFSRPVPAFEIGGVLSRLHRPVAAVSNHMFNGDMLG